VGGSPDCDGKLCAIKSSSLIRAQSFADTVARISTNNLRAVGSMDLVDLVLTQSFGDSWQGCSNSEVKIR
jgi:hypothetical protein